MTTGEDLRAGRSLLAVADSGGVAHQRPEPTVALADALLAALGV